MEPQQQKTGSPQKCRNSQLDDGGHTKKGEEKQMWPEVEGKTFEEAEEIILKDNPKLKVYRVPEGSMVTADYRTDRVRVYVNADGKVVGVPRIG